MSTQPPPPTSTHHMTFNLTGDIYLGSITYAGQLQYQVLLYENFCSQLFSSVNVNKSFNHNQRFSYSMNESVGQYKMHLFI